MSFGNRLKKLREARRLSIEQLAQQSELDPLLIEKIENNQNTPSIYFVQTISRFFNVSTDFLLGMTDEKERIMTVVKEGKSTGDVVIQMLTEMGMIYQTDAGDYQLSENGALLSPKEISILDLIRRQNDIRLLIKEAEDLGYNLEEYTRTAGSKQEDVIRMLKSKIAERKKLHQSETNGENDGQIP